MEFFGINSQQFFIEERMFNANLITKYTYLVDAEQRARDRERELHREEAKRYADSVKRATDSVAIIRWFSRTYSKRR